MVTFLWTRRNIRAPPLGTLFWVVRGVCLSYHALLRHCCLDLATDDLGQRGAVLRGSEASLWLSSTGLAAGDLGRLSSGLVDVHVQPVPLLCCTLGKTQNGSYFFFCCHIWCQHRQPSTCSSPSEMVCELHQLNHGYVGT